VATELPVFAAGVVPTSPAANGPGVVGAPVICGGLAVRSGDIVIGDADGVVVVPLDQAEAVAAALDAVRAAEAKAIAAVEAGAVDTERMRRILAEARIIG
jgi:4-hydroxy-4-methyl-2-oxoglutarate aldolase